MSVFSAVRTLAGPVRRVPRVPDGPLRIAMSIETVQLGGAETVVLQLSQELRARGHVVLPIGPAGRDGWMKTAFLDDGFPWHEYQLRRALDWGCAEDFARLFRELRVDVSHAHEFTASVYGAAGAQLAGVRHINTMHGFKQMTEKLQRRIALRWAFRRSAATVAVSKDTCTFLESELGLPPTSVTLVRNGVPERPGNRERIRRELGLLDNELLVLAVGSLMARKGHRYLLEAIAAVDARGNVPPWRVLIAGEGAERPALEAYIREHGLSGRAALLGNRLDVPDLQAAADVFAMPSLWEGLPLAVLEAMFAANPIVATTASGIPEAVIDGREGFLVEAGSTEALATALHRLLTDADLRHSMGDRARGRATEEFGIRVMADAYERLYRG